MWDYDLIYAGDRAGDHGLAVVKRPDIPAPVRDYTEVSIPGRDGSLYIDEGTVGDIVVSVTFNFMGRPDEWFGRFREAKRWLLQGGRKELQFMDDAEYFYLAKKVVLDSAERSCLRIGQFAASFYCSGYHYLVDGKREYGLQEVRHNAFETSHPIYTIQGEGLCEIQVNNKAFRANVGQNATIDTERMVTCRKDGTLMNTDVEGDYEDLYLIHGDNEIEATPGFSVKVVPNWRRL